MRKFALIMLCLLLTAPGLAQEEAADRDALIERLIAQLGSSKWRERENAQKELERIGEPALERLKDAARGEDIERSSRAGKIIEKIEKTLTKRRVAALTEKALKALRPGEKVPEVEREVFRRIAEAAIAIRSSKDAPVVAPGGVQESEPDRKVAARGRIGAEPWVIGQPTPVKELYRYRGSYNDVLNMTLVLAAAQEGTTPQQRARLVYQVQKAVREEVVQRLLEFCASENITLKLTAMLRFGECAGEKYKAYFLRWLEDPQPQARMFAADALYGLKFEGGVPEALKKALADRDYRVRYGAVRAVGATEDPGVTGVLLPGLQDKSSQVRMAAVSALGHGPVDKVRDALLKALRDKNERVVAAAVTSLGMLNDAQALEKIAPLVESQSIFVKRAVVEALVRTGLEKYFDKLTGIGSETQHTWYVVSALKENGGPRAFAALEKILARFEEKQNRQHYHVRVLDAMLGINEEKARERILRLFRDDETDAGYKGQLTGLLKKCPDKAVIEALIEQLDSKNWNLYGQSLGALRYMTARELDSVGYFTVASEERRKQEKKKWQEWWSQSKESFSVEKAAAARLERVQSLLSRAKKLLSEGKYQEARDAALSARRLEPGSKETGEVVRKASLLQGVEQELKLRQR